MLIGYRASASRIANEVVARLQSVTPYWGFSVRGARRSGRSSYFAEIASQLNTNTRMPINCFVGELTKTTPEGFEQALLRAIESSSLCSHDYSSLQGSVQNVHDFFMLASTLCEQENKYPVFLIDMGGALEESFQGHADLEKIAGFSRLLKQIANFFAEKHLNIILGLGFTFNYVHSVEDIFADVYIHRYPSIATLKNTTLEGDQPGKSFKQIVKAVSGLDIPDDFKGLWRGDNVVVAGQLSENLVDSGASEISGEVLWDNLNGKWKMLGDIQVTNIPVKDLSDLILRDAILPQDKYLGYLERCDEGYRATDNLYQLFGFVSPRRDPGKIEQIKRRIEDPEDQEIVVDILNALGKHMGSLGTTEITKPKTFEHKCGFIEMQVNFFDDERLSALEKELCEIVFPRKMLVVAVLTTEPDETAIYEKIVEYENESNFILIIHLDEVVFGRIPLGRKVNEKTNAIHIESVTIEELIRFIIDQGENVLDDLSRLAIKTITKLFERKQPYCLNHQLIKQIISGTINAGSVQVNVLVDLLSISKMDLHLCLRILSKPQVLTKTKDVVSWDPDNDYLLKVLQENSANLQEVVNRIRSEYVVGDFSLEETIALYQCITGESGIEGLTDENILTHEKQNQHYKLRDIEQKLKEESSLYSTYIEKLDIYKQRELISIEDIRPYRKDINNLFNEVIKALEAAEEISKKAEEELRNRSKQLKKTIESLLEFYSGDNQLKDLYEKIDGSDLFNPIYLQQTERITIERSRKKNEYENRLKDFDERLRSVYGYRNEDEYNSAEKAIRQLKEVITFYQVDQIEELTGSVNAILNKLEKKKTEQSILQGMKTETFNGAIDRKPQDSGLPSFEEHNNIGGRSVEPVNEDGIEINSANELPMIKDNDSNVCNKATMVKENGEISPTNAIAHKNDGFRRFDLSIEGDRKELALELLRNKDAIKRIEVEVE